MRTSPGELEQGGPANLPLLSAETITNQQLFDLLAEARYKVSLLLRRGFVDELCAKWSAIEGACETALGRRRPKAKGEKSGARARCAEFLNARLSEAA